ncbi:hypothetical protein [Mycobacterium stomatepiae]|uniref:Uncharacterized protein n=1 Tax=Mycobacterium stomatepiae TaxID=470076 RepID=A0A7I7QCS6_9MYCO|nr:hypothetical protein [Mycobacterium stomatepiae]MCV7164998.1 hypothetical protein [Mycobacterium stomatepiae]BBY24128.1 hypothetical protein MSTO_43330 [Mycobacterium stomatepiae]
MSGGGKITKWIAARRKDFLPLSLTIGGVLISAGAIWWGSTIDFQNFWLNVLAALALLGPGLVLSNLLVSRFESIRSREEAEARTEPLLIFTHGLFSGFIDMANELLSMASSEIRRADPKAFGYEDFPKPHTLPALCDVLRDARRTIVAFDANPPVGVTTKLPLPDDRGLTFPRTKLVLTVVEMMDREIPMPLTVLAAHGLWDSSNNVGVDFIAAYPNESPLRAPGDDFRNVVSSQVGFAAIGNYCDTGARGRAKRHVGTVSYVECVMNSLRQAEVILKSVISVVPDEILPSAARIADLTANRASEVPEN